MRAFRVSSLALLLLLALSALATEISIDYHRGRDFSVYKTFTFKEGTPAAQASVDRYILASLEETLVAKGLKRVEEGADLIVRYHASVAKVTEVEKTAKTAPLTGLPKWDYSDFQDEGVVVNKTATTQGALTVDMEEAATGTPVWRGAASEVVLSDVPPEDVVKKVDEAVRLLFIRFPPKKAATPQK